MTQTTLLVMAAGIGSRFGTGIKQLTPVDENNHLIIDYSVHDAIDAGFNKIVFIIRKEIEEEFREVIGNRIEIICNKKGIDLDYAFQDINDASVKLPKERVKPLGTGHAVLCARHLVNTPFAVINADDYYGKEAYVLMHDWLCEGHENTACAMIGYVLENTLSDNGGVARGICHFDEKHNVTDVVEMLSIVKFGDGAESDGIKLDLKSIVSMNIWGFGPEFTVLLESGLEEFFKTEFLADPLKAEFRLPNFISGLLSRKECTVKVLPTSDRWYGMTYKEDAAWVRREFENLIKTGIYSKELF